MLRIVARRSVLRVRCRAPSIDALHAVCNGTLWLVILCGMSVSTVHGRRAIKIAREAMSACALFATWKMFMTIALRLSHRGSRLAIVSLIATVIMASIMVVVNELSVVRTFGGVVEGAARVIRYRRDLARFVIQNLLLGIIETICLGILGWGTLSLKPGVTRLCSIIRTVGYDGRPGVSVVLVGRWTLYIGKDDEMQP